MNKPRIFSGIQPSGNLHLGNYLGAISNWVKLQDQYDSIFCVVDMHAITVPQDPAELRRRTIEVAKVYLASGIDPKKSTLFIQSQVSEHAELAWILNTITKISELERMTQFKDKAGIRYFEYSLRVALLKESENNNGIIKMGAGKEEDINRWVNAFLKSAGSQIGVDAGLMTYPVLMASDILLYDTNLVPVGKDQKQHVELTRTLAERFNKKFGETFVIPKAYTTETSENIMGLDDPSKKMSKSAKSEYNYIALSDDEETVRRKIKKAVTDSGSEIIYRDDKPALNNLINIYSLLSEISPKEIEKKYIGKGYAEFKTDLANVVVSFMKPLQEKIKELSDEKVLQILEDGAKKVRPIAKKKLEEVKKKIGFIS
ncbi:MAG: tryptophan--tRNA ligase [bacterium]|nr:tryptophan--tRNA ligase [bacterium]